MGQVAATLTVMLDGPAADIKKIKEEIKKIAALHKNIQLRSMEEKPVAFGIKSIEVLLVLPDSGGTDAIEQDILKIPGISSVEAGDVTLI